MISHNDDILALPETGKHPIFRQFSAAILSSFLVLILTISHAALIFSGPLAVYFPASIALALISSLVIAGICSWFSSLNGTVSFTHSVAIVTMATMAATINETLPFNISHNGRLATILTCMAIATIATGLFFIFIGANRLGRLVRYVPIPVIGGFIAAMGWLVATGAIEVATGAKFSLNLFSDQATAIRLAVALALGIILFCAGQRVKSPYCVPLTIALALILFHAIAWQINYSQSHLIAAGWLVDLPNSKLNWPPLSLDSFNHIYWSAIIENSFTIITMMMVTAMALLMSISGIELATGQSANLDRELVITGCANIIAGATGGMAGCTAVSNSLTNIRLGGNARITAGVIAITGVAVLFYGGHILRLVPMPFYGGLLFWMSFILLKRWLFDTCFQLAFTEYAIIVLMVVVTAFIGFIAGLVTGLIAGIVLFVIDYSQVNVVKSSLSGQDFHSKREMSTSWHQALYEHGAAITVLRLQGFIFFGTAHQLVERLEQQMASTDLPRLRFLLLDFHRTSGIDLSAAISFIKLERLAHQHKVKLVLTHMSDDVHCILRRAKFAQSQDTPVRFFPELNDGLRWCEDKLILRFSPDIAVQDRFSIEDQMQASRIDPAIAAIMMRYMEQRDIESGDILIEEHATSRELYFVESGLLRVVIPHLKASSISVNFIGPGSIAGEISFYTESKRTASVVCEKPGVVWTLTHEALQEMTQQHPAAASVFHHAMARLLAERVAATTRLVRILAD